MSEGCTAIGGMLIWMTCSVSWGPGDNLAQAAAKDYIWVHGPSVARVYVDVLDP